MTSVLDKARVKLVINEPFFATLMLGMEMELCEKLPGGEDLWIAATDGTTLYFNDVNANKLPLEQCIGALKHELMHAALLHPFRVGQRDRKKANDAMDYVINDMIIHEGGALPEGILHDPNHWNREMSWEQVYSEMPDLPPGDGPGGEGDGPGGEGDGPVDPFDNDVMPAPDQSPQAQQDAIGRVVQAAQVAKAVGNMPQWIQDQLGEMLDPKVAWEQELLEFLTEVSRNDYSFARPNRKFIYQDMYLPSPYSADAMGRLAVVFDTSGSVSMDEMNRFASELVGAIEGVFPLALDVIYCDAAVQHVDSFEAPTVDDVQESLHRYGCGGTDMTVAVDYIEENITDVKACIVFTDGFTPFGHERDFPILWAMTSEGIEPGCGRGLYVPIQ